MSCERANVQRNVEKALINRRTYLRTGSNVVKTLRREKRWEEKLLYERSNKRKKSRQQKTKELCEPTSV